MEFFQIYKPLTASPFFRDATYREYNPCEALKPYIRCFWGSEKPYIMRESTGMGGAVIPDTCMDIIIDVNFPPLLFAFIRGVRCFLRRNR